MFSINGKNYNVMIESVERNFSKEYKYQVTTEDGKIHKEVRSVYVDYTIKIGHIGNDDYYNLVNELSGTESNYTVVLPYNGNNIELECDIEITGDAILVDDGINRLWDGLTIEFYSNSPLDQGDML